MDWNYVFFVNMISAAVISAMYLTKDNMPWYLTAILCLNLIF